MPDLAYRLAILVAAGLSCGALAGCKAVDTPIPVTGSATDLAPFVYGREIEVEIDAAKEWQSAGFAVEVGDTYRLVASGQWSVGGFCGVSDADGNGVSPLCEADMLGIGARGSALIGRIGRAGKPFPVGSNRVLKPAEAGELFLRSYDWLPADNTGSMRVRIRHDDAAVGQGPAPSHRDPI